MEWIRTWHARNIEEKVLLKRDQETLMGIRINLQYIIGKGDRDQDREEEVGKILEGIILDKNLTKKSS